MKTMKNPFDSIEEPDKMPNPGFMCRQYIETHNNIKKYWPRGLCVKQCDECINKMLEHHIKKVVDYKGK